MRVELLPRPEPSGAMLLLSPLLSILATVALGAAMFALLGIDPARALYVYFVEPLTQAWALEEIAVKASPLILIAIGLSVCFRANVWNIGAEGQFTAGALAGSAVPILLPDLGGPLVLPLMLALGLAGGAAWGAIPALLKNRFGANEILTSLMLTYVALLLLDWLVRGPWRDPQGYNFPQSALFSADATIPLLFGVGRLHWGVLLAPLLAALVAWRMASSVEGFAIRVAGEAPRAARFAGFSASAVTLGAFLFSGALAGLAGIVEVAGIIGQLRPEISPGYGFTAIIVAFLGRLNPLGIVVAGLLLALTYIGGEAAQIALRVPADATAVFQGLLLLMILAFDTLVGYRVRLRSGSAARA